MFSSLPDLFKKRHLCLNRRQQSFINLLFLSNYFLGFSIIEVFYEHLISHRFLLELLGFYKNPVSFFRLWGSSIIQINLPIRSESSVPTRIRIFFKFFKIIRVSGSRYLRIFIIIFLFFDCSTVWSIFLKTFNILQIKFSNLFYSWKIGYYLFLTVSLSTLINTGVQLLIHSGSFWLKILLHHHTVTLFLL